MVINMTFWEVEVYWNKGNICLNLCTLKTGIPVGNGHSSLELLRKVSNTVKIIKTHFSV